jgi:uncharacterized membrane protein
MTNKSIKLLALNILVLLTLMSFASATITLTPSTSTLSQTNGSLNVNIAGITTETISLVADSVRNSKGDVVSGIIFTPVYTPNTISANGTIAVSYTVTGNFTFEEEYSIILTANDGNASTTDATTKLSFTENTDFYDGDHESDLEISDLEFNVKDGFGDDDNYWYPFDEVEISFNVENSGDYDVQNIELQVCLWDETKGKCVFDEDDMEIDKNDFDLDSGDDQDVTMTFVVDADKLIAGNTDYTLYVKAVGEVNDDSSSYDGKETGISISKTGLDIVTSEDFVIINNIQFNPSSASCGDTVEITADVWNIDDADLEDDEVYVLVYSKELGINKVIEFDSGIDMMDYEEISLSVQIPSDAAEKTYAIKFTAYTDDTLNDDEIFQTSKADDEDASYQGLLTLSGTCSTNSNPTVSVSASLESDAVAGKELTVKATIVNTDSKTKTFALSASDYAEWASSAVLDKTSVTINAGESQDVLITLNVNKDVSGEQNFNIEVLEGNKFLSQPVEVTVEKSSFTFPSITGLFSNIDGQSNLYLWGIGALNVLLILVIIVVAVKVIKKK